VAAGIAVAAGTGSAAALAAGIDSAAALAAGKGWLGVFLEKQLAVVAA